MTFSTGRKTAVFILAALSALSAGFAAEQPASAPAAATAGRPALLNDAFNAFLDHQGRWAFTESSVGIQRDGKPGGETVFRVDPSLPYVEQYTPIKIAGNSPTQKQLKEAAERGELVAKHRAEQQLKASTTEPPAMRGTDEVNIRINGTKIVPQLDHAVVVQEDATSVTYDVPMLKEGGGAGDVFDKYQLTARVNKQRRDFELVKILQRAAMRVKLVAKVADGLIEIQFTQPDPKYPSFPTKVSSKAKVALFFGKYRAVGGESVRTDLKHVTPYDERFGVKFGPMRTMEL